MPVGTYGHIRVQGTKGKYRALALFRDLDGKTRQVERGGSTKAQATEALKLALRDRARLGTGISGETRLEEVATLWFTSVEQAVEAGERSPGTAELYRRQMETVVVPGVGSLRVREATVPVLDSFVQTVRARRGPAAAKLARSVLSGVMGLAVRHGAVRSNPVRDLGPVHAGRRKPTRALTLAECRAWLAQLEADEAARDKDLPDLCRFMLATGVRIGEALAVAWPEVDIEAGVVDVSRTLIRLTGVGLVRKSTKTEAGERRLILPRFALKMLRARNPDDDAMGPVFPDTLGGWRDPSNTRRALRDARGSEGFAWVTSHVFRKTCATVLDGAGQSPRAIADQLGHAQVSMTQNFYYGRRIANPGAAAALDAWHGLEDESHG
jgi:integrase